MANIAGLMVSLGLNASGFHSGLNAAEQSAGRLNGVISKTTAIQAALGGAISTATGFLSDAARASAAEEANIDRLANALENANSSYDDNQDSIEGYIAGLGKMGIADDKARDSLSTLVQTTGSYDEAMKLMPITMDLARAKHMDFEGAAKLVGRVNEGNTSILKRYGIVLGDNATSTEALAAMQQKFGGAAESYGKTSQGVIDSIGVALGNLKEDIGGAMGAATPFVAMLPGFSSGFTILGGAMGGLGGLFKGVAAGEELAGQAANVSKISFLGLNMAMGPMVAVIAGIAIAAGLLYLAWTRNWGDIQGKTTAVVNAIGAALGWLKDGVGNALGAIVTTVGNWLGWIGGLPQRVWDAGTKIVQGLIDGVLSKANDLKNALIGPLQGIMDLLPHSPAKEGPLTQLYAGGQGIPAEIARGIYDNRTVLVTTTRLSLQEQIEAVNSFNPQFYASGKGLGAAVAQGTYDNRMAMIGAVTSAAEDLKIATDEKFRKVGDSAAEQLAEAFKEKFTSDPFITAVAGLGSSAGQLFDRATSSTEVMRNAQRAGNWAQGQGSFFRPTTGPITSKPGDSMWYGTHLGYDIAPPAGSPIFAAEGGSVHNVYDPNGYGYLTIITTPDGKQFYYAHQPSWSLAEGTSVKAGQQIGVVGSTGNSSGAHLHFEARGPGGEQLDVSRYIGLNVPTGIPGLPSAVSDLAGITGTGQAAGTSGVAAVQAIDPVEAATKMVERLKGAIEVINSINSITEPTPQALGVFGAAVSNIVTWLQTIASRFSIDGLNAARDFSESAGPIVDFADKAIDPINRINSITEPTPQALGVFGAAVTNVVTWLQIVARRFDGDGVAAAAAFSESAGKIMDNVDKAIDPINKINTVTEPSGEALGVFAAGLTNVTTWMVAIAGKFKADGVAAAAVFADAVGKIVSPIKAAVDSFGAIQDYSRVPAETMDVFFADLKLAVTKMIFISGEIDQNMLPPADAFAVTTTNIFTTMKGAIDVFQGLLEYKGIPVQVLDAFFVDLQAAVLKMGQISTTANIEMATKANEFATAIGGIFGTLKSALDLFGNLKDYEAIPSNRMDTLLINLKDALEKLAPLNVTAANLEDQAKKFFERAWNAYWYIRTGMAMNDTVPQNYVPGPSGYHPEGPPAPSGLAGMLPGFGDGGLALKPMIARLAEKGPEIIAPLSEVAGLGARALGIDYDRLAEAVAEALSKRPSNTYNLTANYPKEEPASLISKVRMMQMLGGAT